MADPTAITSLDFRKPTKPPVPETFSFGTLSPRTIIINKKKAISGDS